MLLLCPKGLTSNDLEQNRLFNIFFPLYMLVLNILASSSLSVELYKTKSKLMLAAVTAQEHYISYTNDCVVYLLSSPMNKEDCNEPSPVRNNFCHSISISEGMSSTTIDFLGLRSLFMVWI